MLIVFFSKHCCIDRSYTQLLYNNALTDWVVHMPYSNPEHVIQNMGIFYSIESISIEIHPD